jgi:bifunctional non-homologous end joining protein LigD
MSTRLLPMLAVPGEPFDSAEHLFEVKWDGVRALAQNGPGGWALWGREGADYRARYPELAALGRLPAGTVLDGELVRAGPAGLSDLAATLSRHRLTHPARIDQASRRQPVGYVVFDLLYLRGRSLLGQPLRARRAALQDLLQRVAAPCLVFSAGVAGAGQAFFHAAVAQGQEGVMAKHLASRYRPGRRTAAWRKTKPRQVVPCVIVGWAADHGALRRLQVAAPRAGHLQYVATLEGGWSVAEAAWLQRWLVDHRRARPVVVCPPGTAAVEPARYCRVRCLGWTAAGRLRSARFAGLLPRAAEMA